MTEKKQEEEKAKGAHPWGKHAPSYQIARVRYPAPDFSGTAWTTGGFKKINLKKYAGSYLVLFFYPMDFTFVCPTEIVEFSSFYDSFKESQCEVVGCSGDTQFVHMEYCSKPRAKGGLGPVKMPLLADPSHKVAKAYGAYVDNGEEEGVSLRATYIIDGKGVLRHMSLNDLPVGRNVQEVLRLVQAFQYTDLYGEVCPANWGKGDKTLVPDPTKNKEFWEGDYAKK